ncbi:hypothetical protein ACFL0W_04730 [Nanoarchaeota archaeon]
MKTNKSLTTLFIFLISTILFSTLTSAVDPAEVSFAEKKADVLALADTLNGDIDQAEEFLTDHPDATAEELQQITEMLDTYYYDLENFMVAIDTTGELFGDEEIRVEIDDIRFRIINLGRGIALPEQAEQPPEEPEVSSLVGITALIIFLMLVFVGWRAKDKFKKDLTLFNTLIQEVRNWIDEKKRLLALNRERTIHMSENLGSYRQQPEPQLAEDIATGMLFLQEQIIKRVMELNRKIQRNILRSYRHFVKPELVKRKLHIEIRGQDVVEAFLLDTEDTLRGPLKERLYHDDQSAKNLEAHKEQVIRAFIANLTAEKQQLGKLFEMIYYEQAALKKELDALKVAQLTGDRKHNVMAMPQITKVDDGFIRIIAADIFEKFDAQEKLFYQILQETDAVIAMIPEFKRTAEERKIIDNIVKDGTTINKQCTDAVLYHAEMLHLDLAKQAAQSYYDKGWLDKKGLKTVLKEAHKVYDKKSDQIISGVKKELYVFVSPQTFEKLSHIEKIGRNPLRVERFIKNQMAEKDEFKFGIEAVKDPYVPAKTRNAVVKSFTKIYKTFVRSFTEWEGDREYEHAKAEFKAFLGLAGYTKEGNHHVARQMEQRIKQRKQQTQEEAAQPEQIAADPEQAREAERDYQKDHDHYQDEGPRPSP